MKKELYILPAWEDDCEQQEYKKIAKLAEEKGYEVHLIDIDWKRTLSEQIFEVPEFAVIFGFSLGAIFGLKVSQKYKCSHLILGSMAKLKDFEDEEIKQSYIDLLGKAYVEDFLVDIKEKSLAENITTMYGEKEGELGDITVSNTEHELSDEYIEKVISILE